MTKIDYRQTVAPYKLENLSHIISGNFELKDDKQTNRHPIALGER